MALENTVSGLACLLQSMCRRQAGSPYAQNRTHLRLVLQRAPPLHSHPRACGSPVFLGIYSFWRVLPQLFLNIETPYKALSRQCHFLVLILLLECCGLNPGLTHSAWMVYPPRTVPRPICPEFLKLLLVLTCRSFGFILFSVTKKGMKQKDKERKGGRQDYGTVFLSEFSARLGDMCL